MVYWTISIIILYLLLIRAGYRRVDEGHPEFLRFLLLSRQMALIGISLVRVAIICLGSIVGQVQLWETTWRFRCLTGLALILQHLSIGTDGNAGVGTLIILRFVLLNPKLVKSRLIFHNFLFLRLFGLFWQIIIAKLINLAFVCKICAWFGLWVNFALAKEVKYDCKSYTSTQAY
jgi:hypothetical protein